jgi:DNA-binding winged helix-turn-helix (wHTH) protein
MDVLSRKEFKFNDFRLDGDRSALYHRGELIKEVEKKSLEVLAALLQAPNSLVNHDEIIEQVWRDNPHGVTAARVNQYISKLQKLFEKYEPERKFIENVRGRGYIFTCNVDPDDFGSVASPVNVEPQSTSSAADKDEKNVNGATRSKKALAVAVVVILLLFSAWLWYPKNDEAVVRGVVKDSQVYESLVLYREPVSFSEGDLDRYWTPELDINFNYDRGKIRKAVEKLVVDSRRYGDETKCEQFDFQSVEINADGDTAIVKTLEKWFIAEYRSDGTLIKNKHVGPYFVNYVMKKIDGRWLIEKSNTARANLPAPHLSTIEATTPVEKYQRFFVRITGEDFLSEVVYIKVIGVGCPETDPCKVPNSALRLVSRIGETTIENVPLTLASGEFQIFAHNGDSQASNPVRLTVP